MKTNIKYSINKEGQCLTVCPNGKPGKVASHACTKNCKHFIMDYEKINIITCDTEYNKFEVQNDKD
jgi:hypothetical protein